jgi:hypothetical protein
MSQQKKSKLFSKCRAGVSLLISIGLITVVLLVAIGVTSVVISSIRSSSNVNKANQAYYAAEGALETGLLKNQDVGAGYSGTKEEVSYCNPNDQGCVNYGAKANYKIQGQVPETTKYADGNYGIPTPGTGSAAIGCDALNPYISGTFYYSPTQTPHYIANPSQEMSAYLGPFDAVDHPCNWNKINVEETVTVPLYTTEPDGTIKNPIDLSLTGLKIRVRTPCEDGTEACPDGTRYVLDTMNGDEFFKCDMVDTFTNCGDTIIAWEINGTNAAGDKTYHLGPNKSFDQFTNERKANNSEIYEYKINLKSGTPVCPFCLLHEMNSGEELTKTIGLLKDFLLDGVPLGGNGGVSFVRTGNDKINKPVLKLKVIHSLQEYGTQKTIPHLEYQILSDAALAPADVSQTVTAEGFSGSFKQVLEVKKAQESGVLEYVIQQ